MHNSASLLLDRPNNFWVAVAQVSDSKTGRKIEQPCPVLSGDIASLSVHCSFCVDSKIHCSDIFAVTDRQRQTSDLSFMWVYPGEPAVCTTHNLCAALALVISTLTLSTVDELNTISNEDRTPTTFEIDRDFSGFQASAPECLLPDTYATVHIS